MGLRSMERGKGFHCVAGDLPGLRADAWLGPGDPGIMKRGLHLSSQVPRISGAQGMSGSCHLLHAPGGIFRVRLSSGDAGSRENDEPEEHSGISKRSKSPRHGREPGKCWCRTQARGWRDPRLQTLPGGLGKRCSWRGWRQRRGGRGCSQTGPRWPRGKILPGGDPQGPVE